MNLIQRIPGFNILLTLATYVWINIFFLVEMVRQKKYEYFMPGILIVLSVGILFLTPVSGNVRYVLPLFFMSMFEIGVCLRCKGEEGE